MELNEYQLEAQRTLQTIKPEYDLVVPLLGISGEVGELLNAYKKRIRDGDAHIRFSDQVAEELGDILWYLSDIATKFGLSLDDVALKNLNKVNDRWGSKNDHVQTPARIFDANFPIEQRLPRHFQARFEQMSKDGQLAVSVYVAGTQMGQSLTDNSHEVDGYRFHDVFHLACAAVLGWSPVTRRNLNKKRRHPPIFDEVEDGGRAIVTEEGISALVFAYASEHARMSEVFAVDYQLLKAIRNMTSKFEVAVCTTGEWERTILLGYEVWRQVEEHSGGLVNVNLDERSVTYEGAVS